VKTLLAEAKGSASRFPGTLIDDLSITCRERSDHRCYLPGYLAVVSLQGWRQFVFERMRSESAAKFFLECQNDSLQSLALSLVGMWRPALQSLRAALEGCLAAAYYSDHPVEARRWTTGSFSIGFSQLLKYFEEHPADLSAHARLNPLPALEKEYTTLSQAVHGSRLSFRMSTDGQIALSRNDGRLHSMWLTRHRSVLQAINLLLCGLFRDDIRGNDHAELRKTISLAVPRRLHEALRRHWGVRLYHA